MVIFFFKLYIFFRIHMSEIGLESIRLALILTLNSDGCIGLSYSNLFLKLM